MSLIGSLLPAPFVLSTDLPQGGITTLRDDPPGRPLSRASDHADERSRDLGWLVSMPVRHGRIEVVRWFLDRGVHTDVAPYDGRTGLPGRFRLVILR